MANRNILSLLSKVQHQTCVKCSTYQKPTGDKSQKWVFILFGIGTCGFAIASWRQKRFFQKQNEQVQKQENWKEGFMKNKAKQTQDYHGYKMPFFYMNEKENIKKFPVDKSDIFVCSFPKSGTTWVQEIVYLLLNGANAQTTETLESRFPYLEYIYPGPKEIMKKSPPRNLKTHLPYSLLPEKLHEGQAKVIYIARNPKDVSVSYWYFHKMIKEVGFQGDFKDFFTMLIYPHEYTYGPWWKHVAEYWLQSQRKDSNVLFIMYEELSMDPLKTIKKIASFLGVNTTDEELTIILQRTSFESMKNNDTTNYKWWHDLGVADKEIPFMRKGKVGDWKNYFDSEMNAWMDKMVDDTLTPLGLKFIYSFEDK